MAKTLYIIGNATTNQAYTVKLCEPEEVAIGIANGSEFFIPFDKGNPSHLAFRAGDIHDGKGNLTPPVLTQAMVDAAKEAVQKSDSPTLDKASALAACDSASTVDELPVSVVGDRHWLAVDSDAYARADAANLFGVKDAISVD